MDFDRESFRPALRALVIALILIAAFVGFYWVFLRRGVVMLRGWAAENGFQIINFNKHYMVGAGPFKAWTNSRSQLIYSVAVRDKSGHERKCWVRVGSYLGGPSSSKVEVKWDDVGT